MNDYTLDEAHAILEKQRARLQFLRHSVEELGELAIEGPIENPVSAGRRLERIFNRAQSILVEVRHIEAPKPVETTIKMPPELENAEVVGE